MKVKTFLKLVEIQTKVASVIPFLLGTVYALYRFDTFKVYNFLLMLASLLCIDMATTTINNYQDYKRANKKYGYGYESHNAIVRDNIKERTVVASIFILLFFASILGLILYINTNEVVLFLGGVSFVIGILYTYGPVPISRTPFGEAFSGGVMGFIIPFLAVYIHVFDKNIVSFFIKEEFLSVNINMIEILYIVLISIPTVIGIANIMLANNICDIDDDIQNKRHTLPIYVGKDRALKLYKGLYYVGYLIIIVMLVLKVLPVTSILVLFTFYIVNKNIKIFLDKQLKEKTFVLTVKNFVILNVALIITILIDLLITLY